MRISAVTLLAFAAQTYASSDTLGDTVVDKMANRAFKAPNLYTDLDDSTHSKGSAVAASRSAPAMRALPMQSAAMAQGLRSPQSAPARVFSTPSYSPSSYSPSEHLPSLSDRKTLIDARAKAWQRSPQVCLAAPTLNKMKVEDVDVKDKRVFIRVDFNVPQDKKDPNIITNTARIDAALPTIKAILDKGAKSVVLASHLGRPDGMVNEKFSLAPVAKVVEEKLGRPVQLMTDVVGADVEAACADPAPG